MSTSDCRAAVEAEHNLPVSILPPEKATSYLFLLGICKDFFITKTRNWENTNFLILFVFSSFRAFVIDLLWIPVKRDYRCTPTGLSGLDGNRNSE